MQALINWGISFSENKFTSIKSLFSLFQCEIMLIEQYIFITLFTHPYQGC